MLRTEPLNIAIEIVDTKNGKVYMIYREAHDGVREYLTPKMKFDRFIGSRGYIKKWENVVETMEKIFTGEIK